MTAAQILALPTQTNSRLLKASDDGLFYAIEAGESGADAKILSENPPINKSISFLERFSRLPNATIISSSVASPTVITTSAAHGLTSGDKVGINGHTGSTPAVAGEYTVTVLSPTTFTVPVNVTVAGSGGITGKTVQSTELPEIGGAWRMSRNSTGSSFGNENPYATPYGLRSARETLLYLGSEHTDNITSLSFYINWRASLTPLAVPRNQLTIALSASPLLNASGDGINLPPRMLHMNITRNGEPSVGLGTGAGGAVWTSPTSSRVLYSGLNNSSVPFGIPLNEDNFIRVELEEGEMRVFMPSGLFVYNDARFNSDLIGKHWWMEFAGDRYNGADYGEVPYVRNVWLNSPALDSLAGWGSQPRSAVLDRLVSDGLVPYANALSLSGATTHSSTYSSTSTNGIKGTPYLGWPLRPPVYALQTKTTADISSTAGMVYTAGSLLSMEGREPASAGAVNVYEIAGFFADTANDRRIAINEAYAGDIFDSGVLAAADVRNKMWKLKVTMQRTGSHAKRFITEFQVSGSPTIIQTDTTTAPQAATLSIRCSSVAVGDVQIYTYFSKSEFVP